MGKKVFLTLLFSILVISAITGCASNKGEKSDSSKKSKTEKTLESGTIPLRVWAEEDNFEMLNGMIAAFEEKYAGQADFEITLEPQTDSGAKDALLADVHAAADVFSFPDDQFSGLIAAGILEPVTNGDEVKAANLEAAVDAASYNDTVYAYPYTADNGFFLYYDKKYFSDKDVKTLDGILKVAEKNKKKFAMEFNSGWYLYAFFGQTGLEFGINEDGVTNYCNWNSKDGEIKGVDIAKALLKITSSSAFLVQGDGDFVKSIKSGKVIAGVSGTWNATGVKEAWGEDYGAVKLPTYTVAGRQIQMSSFTGYKMMGVNSYSEHKEWAMKLADWLTNEENQTIRFQEKSQGPSNINAAASDEVAKVPAIQAVLDQAQYGNLQRVGNKFWDACTKFADKIAAGNPNNEKLQDIMDTLVKEITSSVTQ